MIERPPHLPHTTPAPHLGPGSPHPSPSSARQVSEEAGVGGGGGRQEGAALAAATWGLSVSLAL